MESQKFTTQMLDEVAKAIKDNPFILDFERECGRDYFQSHDLSEYVSQEINRFVYPTYKTQDGDIPRRDVGHLVRIMTRLTQAYCNIKAREESEALALAQAKK